MGSLQLVKALSLNPLAAALWLLMLLFVPYALCAALFNTRRLRITAVRPREKHAAAVILLLLVLANWVYLILTSSTAR